jgi:hypothetical protein
MEANCCCSGCFRFGRRRNTGTDPDNKPATGTGSTVFNRFSRERSLGFTLEDVNNKASHKAGRQAAKSPLTQYCPPCDDIPTATTVVVGLADSKQHPIKELRGGPAKVSDFCGHHQPSRKMIVKETHHVVRSEVCNVLPTLQLSSICSMGTGCDELAKLCGLNCFPAMNSYWRLLKYPRQYFYGFWHAHIWSEWY